MKTNLTPHQELIVKQAVQSAMETANKRGWALTKLCVALAVISCMYSIAANEPFFFIQCFIVFAGFVFFIHLFLTRTEDYVRGRVEKDMIISEINKHLANRDLIFPIKKPDAEWICNSCLQRDYTGTDTKYIRFYRNQCDLCHDVKFVFKVRDLKFGYESLSPVNGLHN